MGPSCCLSSGFVSLVCELCSSRKLFQTFSCLPLSTLSPHSRLSEVSVLPWKANPSPSRLSCIHFSNLLLKSSDARTKSPSFPPSTSQQHLTQLITASSLMHVLALLSIFFALVWFSFHLIDGSLGLLNCFLPNLFTSSQHELGLLLLFTMPSSLFG